MFDFANTLINIELLGSNNEIIGTPIRFSAAKLQDPISSDLFIYMARLTPLYRIDALRVYHSGGGVSGQAIYLYDFCMIEGGNMVQSVDVNRHITNVPTVISIPFAKSSDETGSSGGMALFPFSNNHCAVPNPEIPILPMQKLNSLECCIIWHFATLYAGAISLALNLAPNSPFARQILLIESVASVMPFVWPSDNLFGTLVISLVSLTATYFLIHCLVYLYRNIVKR